MTKQQAINAMIDGHKVTHQYFGETEWVKSSKNGLVYELEDGVKLYKNEFWKYRQGDGFEVGWEIFKES